MFFLSAKHHLIIRRFDANTLNLSMLVSKCCKINLSDYFECQILCNNKSYCKSVLSFIMIYKYTSSRGKKVTNYCFFI